MKASVKFRDDRHPVVRAKIPINILGLPFVSALAAGDDASEFRLDLSTAFQSGPSVRLSYRPNDAWKPFSVAFKTGFGPLGSPAAAPFSMAAEFSLLPSSCPVFSIVFKPSLGDFTVNKSIASSSIDGGDKKVVAQQNGFPMDITSAVNTAMGGSNYGIAELLSGFEVTARSVLPVRDQANVKLRWGVRVPAELKTAFEDTKSGFPFSKLPLLVMSKISIEHIPVEKRGKESKKGDYDGVVGTEVGEACASVKQQLETLRAENGVLRRAVQELRDEVGGWKATPFAREVGLGRNGGKQSSNVGAKKDYQSDVKSASSSSGKTHGNDNVGEELKKALMKASGGQ